MLALFERIKPMRASTTRYTFWSVPMKDWKTTQAKTAPVTSLRLTGCLLLSLMMVSCSSSEETTTPRTEYPVSIPQTGQDESVRAGDDGDWQAGTALPEPRYYTQADGTVLDKATGLIWLRNLTCLPEVMSWENAINAANMLADDGMGTCGLSDGSEIGDWRLPNVRELQTLIFPGDQLPNNDLPAFSGQQSRYWTSTTYAGDATDAWFLRYGFISRSGKTGVFHVWPVRGGLTSVESESISNSLINVPRTGQQMSYLPGDDGDWQAGMEWPTPRFTDNEDGTSTDDLTGLIWLVNPECNVAGSRWENAIDAVNILAADGAHQCELTDGSRAGDWRMANVLELQSVIDYGQAYPALPTGHPFAPVGEQLHPTWTSTTLSYDAAYDVDLARGSVSEGDGFDLRLWVVPVRGGL